MGLEDFIPSESGPSGPQSAEIAEKIKEGMKKAAAGMKRVQKDEKKAQKFDALLAGFLVEIVKNPEYDFLLPKLFKSLDAGFSSNFLLGLLSLIYLPISDKIRDFSQKKMITFDYIKTFDIIGFDDSSLDEQIKVRINAWVEDIIDILSIEYSHLQMQQIIQNFQSKKSLLVLHSFASEIFIYFFKKLNIEISSQKTLQYTDFILKEIYGKIKDISIDEI